MESSFEANLLKRNESLDRAGSLPLSGKKLLGKYSRNLEGYKLKLDEFDKIYSSGEVQKDEESVKKMMSREDSKTEMGELLEGIIIEQAELSEWFGQDAALVALSEYDDRMAHGDLVLEIRNKKEELIRILVDVTTSGNEDTAKTKLDRSFSSIENGHLSNVKYFDSELDESKGRLVNVPRVVIGVGSETLLKLCEDIIEHKNRQENNPIQLMLLDEMVYQLDKMADISRKKNGELHAVTIKLQKTLQAILEISEKKENLRDSTYERRVSSERTYSLLT